MMNQLSLASVETAVKRLGVAFSPNADEAECEGVLNPAAARDRNGKLLLYPRMVAPGNHSRIGIAEAVGGGDALSFRRIGYALEPTTPYELREGPGGYGCEDPRVTFIPLLDAYVMAYTAYGPGGPRIAFAISDDAYRWERLGLADFSARGLPSGDDKDAAFFPEPVISPSGVPSLAFYHRPMLHISSVDGQAAISTILDLPPCDRECTRIAYVPLEPALLDRHNLLKVAESVIVLEPGQGWGAIKNGAGTPPVRIDEGWFSLFHGVDGRYDADGRCIGLRYSAGIVIHDFERPDEVRYRSSCPLFWPETPDETHGMVNNVVFPTGIDPLPGASRSYDVYYGMADSRIGRLRLDLGASSAAAEEAEESAA
jgi:predicted GH43/DUF377 family glycosyl hydrolase